MVIQKFLKEQHWTSTTVMLFGVISVIVLILIQHIYKKQREESAVIHLLMDLQVAVPNIHLQLEEGMSKDVPTDAKTILDRFDNCINTIETINHGGRLEDGLVLRRIEDRTRQQEFAHVQSLLVSLKMTASKRYLSPENAKNSMLAEKFHMDFQEFLMRAQALERAIEGELGLHYSDAERLIVTLTLSWIFIVAISSVRLSKLERKRKINEIELQSNNRKLKSMTEELEIRERNLAELVEKRTAELSDSNRGLRENILKRNQAIEELETSKNKFKRLSQEFHALLDALPDYLILFNPDLHIRWANAKVHDALRKSSKEIGDHHCCIFSNQNPFHCRVCPVARTFETGKAETTQISGEDGRVWDIRTFPIIDERGEIRNVIEIAREVTDKISLQAGALRAAHLASLGELAAGIAHEINNPVNGIINYAQILLDDPGVSEEHTDIANRIVQEGERTAVIVRSLLSFARETKPEKVPTHPHSLLFETLGLLGRQLEKDSIILILHVSHNLPPVEVDCQQIMQVFLNIISNARYALNLKFPGRDDGKILEIHGEQSTVDRRSFVHMTFHDHGIGIPQEKINKVTDPFFSTKPKGRGTGLGLSISHGIISEHEGRLFIESTRGRFTKVHVFLPMAEQNE